MVTERLYSRHDGLQLGARRGGTLHLADEHTWEVFTLADGVVYGAPVGWVTDEELDRAVANLAKWAAVAA